MMPDQTSTYLDDNHEQAYFSPALCIDLAAPTVATLGAWASTSQWRFRR